MASGFDGRVFLTESEWQTYRRRAPVRYIKSGKSDICSVCGLSELPDNPLQNAHRVGFMVGVIKFALTPDWLDSPENIVVAHRKTCNKKAELSLAEIQSMAMDLSPPEFLKNTVFGDGQ